MARKRNQEPALNNKVVYYMRFSSKQQTENSIDYQRQTNDQFCKKNKLIKVGEYVDEGYTGRNANRPQFQQMITDAQNHPEWQTVIVFDMSRFSRNSADFSYYENLLMDLDIKLVSATERFEDSPQGRYYKGVQSFNNQLTSDLIAKHTHAGLLSRANQGFHCGGIAPLGYDVSADLRLVINEKEAEAVRKIFDMYENNISYQRIADYLNEKGYRTKVGKSFTKHSFYEILQQEKYVGTFTWNRRKGKNSKLQRNNHAEKPMSAQVHHEDYIPAIIDKDQFDRVQDMMMHRAVNGTPHMSRYPYLLTGKKIMHCGVCGRQIVGSMETSHGKKRPCYVCPGHKDKTSRCPTKNLPVKNVDTFVCSHIVENIFKTDDIPHLNKILSDNGDKKALRAKLTGTETSISRVAKALESVCSEALLDRLQALERERTFLRDRLDTATAPAFVITEDNLPAVKQQLADYLLESQDVEALHILKQSISDIKIDNDGILIELNL